MIMKLFTIRDRMTEFGFPIPVENEQSAKRYFRSKIANEPMLKDNPEDFSLWYIGTFDTEKGTINKVEEPILIDGKYIPYVEEEETDGEKINLQDTNF